MKTKQIFEMLKSCLTCAVVSSPALCTVTITDGQVQRTSIHTAQWTH